MSNENPFSGTLFVFSAPSGAGKTSLVKALLETTEDIGVSISHTTRAMRPGEVEGVHYHFISVDNFEEIVARGDFLEHAKVFDNYYGTSQVVLEKRLQQGKDVILEIDWQGAQQVRHLMPFCRTVFILPPSRDELKNRLQARGQDSEEVIARRLQDAVSDMTHYVEFDFVVINDDFEQARQALQAIVLAERQRLEVVARRSQAVLQDLLGTK